MKTGASEREAVYMDAAGHDECQLPLIAGPLAVSAAFEGSEEIAKARELARRFLTDVQALRGLPVSGRAMGMVQLVVSELVTNARKYAPGPCLLTLKIEDRAAQVSVWDSGTAVPAVLAPDPSRIGQHGLEIVMAVCQSFAVRREPVGKRITATVALAADPGGDASVTSRCDHARLGRGRPRFPPTADTGEAGCERAILARTAGLLYGQAEDAGRCARPAGTRAVRSQRHRLLAGSCLLPAGRTSGGCRACCPTCEPQHF